MNREESIKSGSPWQSFQKVLLPSSPEIPIELNVQQLLRADERGLVQCTASKQHACPSSSRHETNSITLHCPAATQDSEQALPSGCFSHNQHCHYKLISSREAIIPTTRAYRPCKQSPSQIHDCPARHSTVHLDDMLCQRSVDAP